jgi:hypothetical protein
MATGILGTDCSQIIGNTGITPCPYNPKNIIGIMLVPTGTAWTPTQVGVLQTTINAGLVHNTPTSRYFPISKFEDVEDKSEAAVETTTGYGIKKFVRAGKYGWMFKYSNGGMDLHSEISKFTGQADRYDCWLMDGKNNCFIGTSSGANNVKGFSLDTLIAENIKLNTGGADTEYALTIGLEDSDELNLNWRVVTVPTTVPIATTFAGLKPTRLEIVTDLVASSKTVVVRVWSGATNLYDTYSGQLNAIAVWDIVNNTGGTSISSATTVTLVPGTKSFSVFWTGLTVSAGHDLTVQLGTVSDLTTATTIATFANSQIGTIAT